MFQRLFDHEVMVGLLQALAAAALCICVVFACRRFGVRVEKETTVSLLRGFVQMSVVGILLAVILKGTLLIGVLILLGMVLAAAVTASRRFSDLPYAFEVSVYSIAAGAGTAIGFMLATRCLTADVTVLVPVGSMIIANSMNACAQAMERLRSDIVGHVGQIEAALSLGAEPGVSVSPYMHTSVYASLLPRLDMLKSLGLVWIPGVMAGMLVSGASPLYAGVYQFVIVAMILVASGISGMGVTALMQKRAFTAAAQLALRPGRKKVEAKGFWSRF